MSQADKQCCKIQILSLMIKVRILTLICLCPLLFGSVAIPYIAMRDIISVRVIISHGKAGNRVLIHVWLRA